MKWLTLYPTGTTQPTASTLNSYQGYVVANAAVVPAGIDGQGSSSITAFVTDDTHLIIDINGYYQNQANSTSQTTQVGVGALQSNSGVENSAVGYQALTSGGGSQNTALGALALSTNVNGTGNTAVGQSALQAGAGSGNHNTAVGYRALQTQTGGDDNTALGYNTLNLMTSSQGNVAVGANALSNNLGGFNVAVGYNSLPANIGGTNTITGNTAIGENSGYQVTTGSYNIFLGQNAGYNAQTGSGNIYIGNAGAGGEGNTIRIGSTNASDPTIQTQSNTYIAGIYGVTVSGAPVMADSTGHLGAVMSSIRFKEDVQDVDDRSDRLMDLRPVSFRYKQSAADGSKPLQYGLIAEEVAKIYPELVIRGKDGQVDSVAYHELPALLLNELQKQHKVIDEQNEKLTEEEDLIKSLQTRLTALEQTQNKQ